MHLRPCSDRSPPQRPVSAHREQRRTRSSSGSSSYAANQFSQAREAFRDQNNDNRRYEWREGQEAAKNGSVDQAIKYERTKKITSSRRRTKARKPFVGVVAELPGTIGRSDLSASQPPLLKPDRSACIAQCQLLGGRYPRPDSTGDAVARSWPRLAGVA